MTLSLGEVHCWRCWVELSWIGIVVLMILFPTCNILQLHLNVFWRWSSFLSCLHLLLLSISQSPQSRVPCDSCLQEQKADVSKGQKLAFAAKVEKKVEKKMPVLSVKKPRTDTERAEANSKENNEEKGEKEEKEEREKREMEFQKCGQNWSWWREWGVGHRLSLFRLRIWELSLSLVWAGEIPYGSGIFRASKSSPPSLPRREPGENQIYEDLKTKNLNQVWAPHFRLTISAAARTKRLLLTL